MSPEVPYRRDGQRRAARSSLRGTVLVLVGAAVVFGCQRPPAESAADAEVPSTLRRGLGAEPETVDPKMAEDNASLAIGFDLHEGLTRMAPDGSVVPGAAERWTVSPDGLEYLFHLRRSLLWSDGSALEARHFAAGLTSLKDPATTAPYAALFDALQDARAQGPHELRVVLKRPVPYLPSLLALPAAAPLAGSDAPADAQPVSGPFRLRSRKPGESLLLERNPHYWDAASVKIDAVRYSTVSDLGTEVNLYRTGELDLTSEVPNAQLDELRRTLPGELRIAPFLAVYAYAVNLQRLPDRDARRALVMSVDRERLTRLVTGAGETPAYGWVPPGIPGYGPARVAWAAEPREAQLDSARSLWQAARVRGAAPATLTLCSDSSANHHRTAIALADFWKSALGVETRIVEMEWSVYLATRETPGECDLVRFGWSGDFVDAEAFLGMFQTGHAQNTLRYSNAAYDAALGASRGAHGAPERAALLAQAESILLDDAPVVPLFFRVTKRLVKPHVQGVQDNSLGVLASRDLRLEARQTP
jgi:oligopeptide transport system substrate-binding protein